MSLVGDVRSRLCQSEMSIVGDVGQRCRVGDVGDFDERCMSKMPCTSMIGASLPSHYLALP